MTEQSLPLDCKSGVADYAKKKITVLLNVYLPYDSSCPSVVRLVGRLLIISWKGGELYSKILSEHLQGFFCARESARNFSERLNYFLAFTGAHIKVSRLHRLEVGHSEEEVPQLERKNPLHAPEHLIHNSTHWTNFGALYN